MSSDFYYQFEQKFRGSLEVIKSRLQFYLQFLDSFKNNNSTLYALDLGCGRGEWLEVLQELHWSATGIDTNDRMIEECKKRGLNVYNIDALTYLKKIDDSSLDIISGFHIVEHLPFDMVIDIFKESLRVLKKGGRIIFETPNPENLIVGTCNFYLDPTHQRPIPPLLLQFAVDYVGFQQSKIVRLDQEDFDILNDPNPTLLNSIRGVSTDYAIIAQKGKSPTSYKSEFDSFDKDYGTNLDLSLTHYHSLTKAHLQTVTLDLDSKISDINISVTELTQHNQQLFNQNNRIESLVENSLREYQNNLTAIFNSRSWIITKPYRLVGRLFSRGKLQGKALLKKIIWQTYQIFKRYRWIKKSGQIILSTMPYVKTKIIAFIQSRNSQPVQRLNQQEQSKSDNVTPYDHSQEALSIVRYNLTKNAHQIDMTLKKLLNR
jgi:O-antigen chain-terminating methyltransferase